MATSSLKKSFVINSKKEADTLAKLFDDSSKNITRSDKAVKCSSISRKQMAQIINAKIGKKK